MRNMSFMLTTQQVRDGTKTVTRRTGWWFLRPGDVVMACEKCQGLKRGEKIKRIRPIRILSTRGEELGDVTPAECVREGFPGLTPAEFIAMFARAHKWRGTCADAAWVNRIEFEYVEEADG